VPLTVPVEGRGKPVPTGMHADAGDDQYGVVGRQMTPQRRESVPREGIGYRWIQVAGPAVSLKIEDRYIYTFVPQEPGLYRFALVVASGDTISLPDTVDILVESDRPAQSASPVLAPPTLRDLAATSLVRLDGGRDSSRALAKVFE